MIDLVKQEELEKHYALFAGRPDANGKLTAMRLARFAEARIKVAADRELSVRRASDGSAETLLLMGAVCASAALGYIFDGPAGWLTFGLLLIAGGLFSFIWQGRR